MAPTYLSARVPVAELLAGFERIREELEVTEDFGPAAQREAQAAARSSHRTDVNATELPFVTIDPEGAMDLDQAVFIQRRGQGYRVHYAIADVPGFLTPGSDLDAEVRQRVVTLYSPDRKVPLHPTVLSEDAASLLPGRERPALVWQLDLDGSGALEASRLQRAMVRSRAKLSYEQVQAEFDADRADGSLGLLREVGRLLQEQERARGGVSLPGAEQEVVSDGGSFRLELRRPLAVEDWNAQISLLTGRAAASMMLAGGIGILRTMPAPSAADIARVRSVAKSLAVDWPDGATYPQVIAMMDPTVPAQAAFLNACVILLRGAGYTAFAGEGPALSTHSAVAAPYAHVTAPLRRLVDRWGLQICLSLCEGSEVPGWVRSSLDTLPELMADGGRRARALERANVDLVEAFVLQDRVGEHFEAVVLDVQESSSLVQLTQPPVIARVGERLPLGRRVGLQLAQVDIPQRCVQFVPIDQSGGSV